MGGIRSAKKEPEPKSLALCRHCQILCGFTSVGKTVVGAGVAKSLSLPFTDTDHLLLSSSKMGCGSLRALWQELGEEEMRALESKVLKDLPFGIIATGGGSCERRENRDALRRQGRVIYLHAPLETLRPRLEKRGLPASIETWSDCAAVFVQRDLEFRSVADVIIETEGLDPDEVIKRVIYE